MTTQTQLKYSKISIIIPVYNTAKYIEKCIKSVIEQTYKNIEIICVDDCSPYKEYEIIQKYAKQDSRIKYIRNSKNCGIVQTRNNGMKHASGEYILPLDSDDYIHKNYCTKAIQIFKENKNISVVYCQAQMFKGNNYWNWNLPPYNKKLMPFSNHVFCSAVFKKTDWQKYQGYDEKMNLGFEDWEFWLNFVEDNKEFYQIPEVLFYYRQSLQSRSDNLNSDKNNIKAMFKVIVTKHKKLYKIYDYFKYIILREKISFISFVYTIAR